jgi:PAS domain S-box-containing protein
MTTGEPVLLDDVRRQRFAAMIAGVVLFIIVGLMALVALQGVSADRLRHAELRSQERRSLLLSVLSAHQDLETGQRGFLLTGREVFLEPYRWAHIQLRRVLPALDRAYANRPRALREVAAAEQASNLKRAFADQTIALARSGQSGAAVEMVKSGRGKALMDRLRLHLARLQRLEAEELRIAAERASSAISRLRWLTFGALGALLVLLAAAGVTVVRAAQARRQALRDVQEHLRRRAAILDSAMDGILTLNPSGTIESLNAAAERMFGYGKGELLRRDVGVLVADPPPIGAVAGGLRQLRLQPGEPGRVQQIAARRKDGSTFPADVAIAAMPLAQGNSYVAVVRDITERERVEQLKAEFVSTVSHELRTPLTSISGSLGLLASGAAGELGAKAGRLVEIARNNADRLVRLINDILDIEKIESGQMDFRNEPLDLRDCSREAIEAMRGFADQYGVVVTAELPDRPAMVDADRDRVAQVLTNLLSNAIKFSPKGGTVRLELSPRDERHRLTVSDQGSGIPETFRDRMFTRFAQADSSDTRQKGGTGLGLSIVREIVRRLGGDIGFVCPPEGGTRFHVDLPGVPEPGQSLPHPSARLLLCADQPQVREALAAAGYEVVACSDPAEARARLARERFAALVLDLTQAPSGASDLIRAARASRCNAGIPVVAIGAASGSGDLGGPAVIADWIAGRHSLEALVEGVARALDTASDHRPRVLHVDDDPDVRKVVASALEPRATTVSVPSLAQARAALRDDGFDLVILDLTLADGNGASLLNDLRRDGATPVPVIVFSAEDAGGDVLRFADAFLTKSRTPLPRLVSLVDELARAKPLVSA